MLVDTVFSHLIKRPPARTSSDLPLESRLGGFQPTRTRSPDQPNALETFRCFQIMSSQRTPFVHYQVCWWSRYHAIWSNALTDPSNSALFGLCKQPASERVL